jgi:hypothetical protein
MWMLQAQNLTRLSSHTKSKCSPYKLVYTRMPRVIYSSWERKSRPRSTGWFPVLLSDDRFNPGLGMGQPASWDIDSVHHRRLFMTGVLEGLLAEKPGCKRAPSKKRLGAKPTRISKPRKAKGALTQRDPGALPSSSITTTQVLAAAGPWLAVGGLVVTHYP